ncbi:MAG: hypothetical protein RSC45_00315 [Acinetobacter sp.]
MKIKRGVREFSNEDFLKMLESCQYLNKQQEITHEIACHLEIFEAQFSGTYFRHAYSLINTVLVDFFVSKQNLYDYENIQYLHEDLCGWRNREFEDILKKENINLEKFKFNFLIYSDFCYELFSYKQVDGIYFLELPDEKIIELEEADFFALCIFTYHRLHPTSHKEDGYWYLSEEDAFTKWLSIEKSQKIMPVTFHYDKVLNTEYWFSIINELFIYFQNALIRSGHKIALSKEKSRLAKIKSEKYKQETAKSFKNIEELWDSGKWKKATSCAEEIFDVDGVNLPYNTVYKYILDYRKSKK